MLEAHIRSFDLGTPTARERLEAALGEPYTRKLLDACSPRRSTRKQGPSDETRAGGSEIP
jgi:hypothetical protein